jgi:integrase
LTVKGTRHVGTTRLSNERAAGQMVQEMREKAKRTAAVSTGTVEMTFAEAVNRWQHERGQFRKGSKDTLRALGWLCQHVGDDTSISRVNNALVTTLVSQRRSEGVTHATVNRTVTQILRAILRRAELWDQPVARIRWGDHTLKEPVERVRELSLNEEDQLFDALRPDFRPIMRFLLLTGRRRAEACKLEWEQVDLNGGRMEVRQKGGLVNVIPLSREAVEVLRAQWRTLRGSSVTRSSTHRAATLVRWCQSARIACRRNSSAPGRRRT